LRNFRDASGFGLRPQVRQFRPQPTRGGLAVLEFCDLGDAWQGVPDSHEAVGRQGAVQ
jgi:hypothetical protein